MPKRGGASSRGGGRGGGVKKSQRSRPNSTKPSDTVVVFREGDRRAYLGGFKARKDKRRQKAAEILVQKERFERIEMKKQQREDVLREKGMTPEDATRELQEEMARADRRLDERLVSAVEHSNAESGAVVTTTVSEFDFVEDGFGASEKPTAHAADDATAVSEPLRLTASELRKAVTKRKKQTKKQFSGKKKKTPSKREKHAGRKGRK